MDAYGSGGNPNTTGTHGTTLTDRAVRMWPTPRAHDSKSPRSKTETDRDSPDLADVVSRLAPTTTTPGNSGSPKADLNPRFVAALMGVPWDWLTPYTSEGTA